jgi:cell wall-associated NlpC family hydrolase
MQSVKAATAAVFLCFVLNSAGLAATIQVQTHSHRRPSTRNLHHRRVESSRAKSAKARHVASGTQLIRERLVRLSTAIHDTEMDCSHFANYVYERVGFTYDYAPSVELYEGAGPFVRVQYALPGDLIVWRGHVGIIVDPDEHTFVSKLNSGVKVADWDTRYWKRRGIPRFFRFTGKVHSAPDLQVAQDHSSDGNANGATD